MIMFEYILILLAAIVLSNIINRFLPLVSVTVIQILLGAGIAFLPFHIQFELAPELFFVLFLAPLVFDNGMRSDKEALWKLKWPIISLAFGLVFVSTITGGLLVNCLMPMIPVAAGCALIASLGPTDDVAVFSLAKRVRLPGKLKNMLEGESVFNDSAGLISFQFAIAAVVTGTFSPVSAAWQLVLISIGGVLIGLVLTVIKYLIVKWIRSLGLENVTLHILVEILTPFIVFIAAEAINCSGIFAVFTSGIMHSFAKKKMNPDNVKLNNASESVWSMFSFTLNGLVFLLMGIQLPAIIKTIVTGEFPIAAWQIGLYAMLIMSFFVVTRFVWSLFIRKKSYTDENETIGKIKAGMIISLSGARGAVTLASILSIPLLLDDGTFFPERDLLILIAASVILLSLILSDFVLPNVIAEHKTEDVSGKEDDAYVEILHGVITALRIQTTPQNRAAVDRVTRDYFGRINDVQNQRQRTSSEKEEEQAVKAKILSWEVDNTKAMLEAGVINKNVAERYIDIIENMSHKARMSILRNIRHFFRFSFNTNNTDNRLKQLQVLRVKNAEYVLKKLNELYGMRDSVVAKKMVLEYELLLNIFETRQSNDMRGRSENKASDESINEILLHGFQLERDGIRTMLEQGRISRETAKEMRDNISALEMKLEEI